MHQRDATISIKICAILGHLRNSTGIWEEIKLADFAQHFVLLKSFPILLFMPFEISCPFDPVGLMSLGLMQSIILLTLKQFSN